MHAAATSVFSKDQTSEPSVILDTVSTTGPQSGGAGWTLIAGIARSPFGACLVAESPRGICHLSFLDGGDEIGVQAALAALTAQWPRARIFRDDSNALRLSDKIFHPTNSNGAPGAMRVLVQGTPFQVNVWRTLLRIPSGMAVSYEALAAAAGMPGAVRAVASAVGRNEVAFIIPCHRVIRKSGALGEYRWGAERKRDILAWEGRSGQTTEHASALDGRDGAPCRPFPTSD